MCRSTADVYPRSPSGTLARSSYRTPSVRRPPEVDNPARVPCWRAGYLPGVRRADSGDAFELGLNPSTPRAARAFVRERWADLAQPELLDAVGLCVSELVTNALDHAEPPY